MKKVIVSTKENLSYGTLIWIYASNKKVYHSSKAVDGSADFSEYDSHYMGKVHELYRNLEKQPALFNRMLAKSDRIFGVCLNKRRLENGSHDVKVLFFPSWENVQEFAENSFPELAEMELTRKKKQRKKQKMKQSLRMKQNKSGWKEERHSPPRKRQYSVY
ncbi:hypothetical protein [Oceanobacillus massiliensis]|uniref:hypothetical protein n=1 Tax=Oceanobacillus massiliensis TaxID=1465765 RepID=UPI0011C908D1|nr:hypothetical protein [Oceanobacillus massiliensis]